MCFRLKLAFPAAFLLFVLTLPIRAQEVSVPQAVRISYLQGDVTVSPGISGRPVLGKGWSTAILNQPIEEGYTLATEEGRAEVEFESGTVAYVAEHSVLQFRTLTILKGTTETWVTLLGGKATLVRSPNTEETLTIETPHVTIAAKDGTRLALCVESAVDGTALSVDEGELIIDQAGTGFSENLNVTAVPPTERAQVFAGGLPLPGEIAETPNQTN